LKTNIVLWGLLQRILVNSKYQVLVGWRRLQAITLLGWEEVEVEVVDVPEDEQAAFIVNSNSQRQKSTVEIYREIKVLKSFWLKKQGTRTDLQVDLPEEEKLKTRERIARSVGTSESAIQKIETVGDKNLDFLTLVDNGTLNSLHEAYEAVKSEKPKHEEEIVEIDLSEIKTCKFCGCIPKRIDTDGNGNLIFKD
jgi:ParB-like chromosome segregation protein Spo0J